MKKREEWEKVKEREEKIAIDLLPAKDLFSRMSRKIVASEATPRKMGNGKIREPDM